MLYFSSEFVCRKNCWKCTVSEQNYANSQQENILFCTTTTKILLNCVSITLPQERKQNVSLAM